MNGGCHIESQFLHIRELTLDRGPRIDLMTFGDEKNITYLGLTKRADPFLTL